MSNLPISPDIYFEDFSFDLTTYNLFRSNTLLQQISGLLNNENNKDYIHFKLTANVLPGDVLEIDGTHYLVTDIQYDYYQGKKALLKAYITDAI